MQIPKLTHLQFAILTALVSGKRAGREIRGRLAEVGSRKSGPAFYQLMGRMEDAGYVTGWYEQEIVESQIIRQRHYRITAGGGEAWQRARNFYAEAAGSFDGAEGVARV